MLRFYAFVRKSLETKFMNHAYLHAACFTTYLQAPWPDFQRELFGGQNRDAALRDQFVVARTV